jgi:hypothetical protein
MRIAGGIILLAGVATVLVGASNSKADIYIVGDYTVADSAPGAYPQMGWGTFLKCEVDSGVTVHNDAIPGSSGAVSFGVSAKSYATSGAFDAVLGQLKSGDTLLIQFGHEDERTYDFKMFSDPDTGFRDYLMRLVDGARSKGAVPVLITPVTRRSYDAGQLVDTHVLYARAVREVAAKSKTKLIDLTADSMAWLSGVGDAPSQKYYIAVAPHSIDSAHLKGVRDDSDLTELGARVMAQLVAVRLADLGLPVSAHVKPQPVSPDAMRGAGK